ncbi:unnamed protein product [Dibothriocephalus latus]|uniref:Uncharacterized protein n=1 Tax=Dibothriocephalus latus TaxID=60516 RepID=A0A3P7NFP6_DIBLA|nr:unnamed protein product [Dibothriocephalus latus]
MCHLRGPADWQGELKASNVFWKDAADMLEPRREHTAVAFRDSIFIAGGRNLQGYLNTIDVFTPPDNQRPLGQWTRLATWSTGRPTAALVVCQDRLFSFKHNREASYTLMKFEPPADPSSSSQGKFDQWEWVQCGWVLGFKEIQRGFSLS